MEKMDKLDEMLITMQGGIDNQSITLLLGILGIAITIFTVVYSFMESTKERKRLLFERVNNANGVNNVQDPLLLADLTFTTNRLKDLWKMNLTILTIILVDILNLVLFIVHLLIKNVAWLWYFALVLEIFLVIGCLITLYIYFKNYYDRFVSLV